MKLSVVVAARNSAMKEAIRSNLAAIKADEIIIAVGSNPSLQRNEGVAAAAGDVIFFADDDTVPAPGAAAEAAGIFEKYPEAIAAGGPAVAPESDTVLQKAFSAAFSSVFGAGSSSSRYSKVGTERLTSEKELILCNMFIKKAAFEELGGFNTALYPNEENEFMNRAARAGHKLVYSPALAAERSARKTYPGFIRQCFRYGRGRAEQVMSLFTPGDIINFAPLAFVFYLFLLLPVFGGAWVSMLPLYAYICLDIWFSYTGSSARGSSMFVPLLINFPLMHVSYGAGMAWGFLAGLREKKARAGEIVEIIKV